MVKGKRAREEQESWCYQPGEQQKWRELSQGQQACWQDLEVYRGGIDVAHWQEEVSERGDAQKKCLGCPGVLVKSSS